MKPFITLLDRFIIKKYLGTFVFALCLFSAIIVIFDISEKIDDMIENHASMYDIIFKYYAGFIPFYLNFLLPLINFIAVIFFTSKMANQTEIVPILTSGVSFFRLMRPYFISASIIFSVNVLFNLYVIPHTNAMKIEFENTFIDPGGTRVRDNIHMKLDKNSYISIESFDNESNIGRRFVLDHFSGKELKQKWVADEITYDTLKHTWQLRNYSVRYVNQLHEKMVYGTVKDTVFDMQPVDFSVYQNVYEAMTMDVINENIAKEEIRGSGRMVNLLIEKYKRWALPLSSFVLTLIGVSLASKKVRGGVGLSLGVGILLSFAYIVANQFATMFSLKGGIPPIVSLFIPNIIFSCIGIFLYLRAPK